MDIKDIFERALKAIDDANVPGDLREIAFGKAIDMMSGLSSHQIAPSTVTGSTAQHQREQLGNGKEILAELAKNLGLDIEVVEEVFHEQDGVPELSVAPGKLESSKTKASRQIALLIAAARQLSGIEEATEFSVIRDVAEQYRKLDGSNFAAAINAMQDTFVFRNKGTGRSIKLSRPGREEAKELIVRLGGDNR